MNGAMVAVVKKASDNLIESTTGFMETNFNAEVARIVNQHGAAAAATAALAGAFTGAGPTVSIVAQTAVIYSMYVRMNHALGIHLSKNVMKSLASAVIANLVSNVGTVIVGVVGATVLSFIPAIGNATSALTMAATGYAAVMISAFCYGSALRGMSKKGRKIEDMTESEIKKAVKREMDARDLNADVKAFSKAYKQGRKDGTFTGKETIDLES